MDRLEQLILKLLSEVGDGYTVDGPNRLESMEACIRIYADILYDYRCIGMYIYIYMFVCR